MKQCFYQNKQKSKTDSANVYVEMNAEDRRLAADWIVTGPLVDLTHMSVTQETLVTANMFKSIYLKIAFAKCKTSD